MPVEQQININDFPQPSETPDSVQDDNAGDTNPDDTQQQDGGEQQPGGGEGGDTGVDDAGAGQPDTPTPDPRDEAIAALRNELAEERRARTEMMERIAPTKPGEQETDYDALINEHFEPDSAAGKVFRKLATTMKADFEKKLHRELGSVRQSTGAMEMEQRETRVIESLVSDGSIKREEVDKLRETAWNGAVAARKRGEMPDLEASYKAAAFDLMRKRKPMAGDEEARKRQELRDRKKVATAPTGVTPTRTTSKLKDSDIAKAVREGKSLGDIWAMDESGKDE
jgi:hypothetical protein